MQAFDLNCLVAASLTEDLTLLVFFAPPEGSVKRG
jgi:hypothetical protein